MKRIVVLFGLSAVACGSQEIIVPQRMAITDPPLRVAGSTSLLAVPTICPVYAPGDGDVQTPEPPFSPGVAIVCGVDDAGGSYGLATGDGPNLNVLPGNHELGVYYDFEPNAGFSPDKVNLTGADANIVAWAGPYNATDPAITTLEQCCPEAHPDAQIPLTLVALGAHGILFSVGRFDTRQLQVFFRLDGHALLGPPPPQYAGSTGYLGQRFYVNGPP